MCADGTQIMEASPHINHTMLISTGRSTAQSGLKAKSFSSQRQMHYCPEKIDVQFTEDGSTVKISHDFSCVCGSISQGMAVTIVGLYTKCIEKAQNLYSYLTTLPSAATWNFAWIPIQAFALSVLDMLSLSWRHDSFLMTSNQILRASNLQLWTHDAGCTAQD